MALTRRQQSGQRAEQVAADFLSAAGCEILARNYRRRLGELDIIARAGGVLVVAEVRTRASAAFGGAAASITRAKQRRVTRAAWPAGGPYRGRLFAFGFDSFRLWQALRHAGVNGAISVAGLTGRLSLDAQRHVRRELGWAQLHDGEVRLLPGEL